MEIHHYDFSRKSLLVCFIMCVWSELCVVYLSLFCLGLYEHDCMSTLVFLARCHNLFEWMHCVWYDSLCCVCVRCECSHFVFIMRLCAMVQLSAFIEHVLSHRNPIHPSQHVNVSECLCGSFIYIHRGAYPLPRYFQRGPYMQVECRDFRSSCTLICTVSGQ